MKKEMQCRFTWTAQAHHTLSGARDFPLSRKVPSEKSSFKTNTLTDGVARAFHMAQTLLGKDAYCCDSCCGSSSSFSGCLAFVMYVAVVIG
jgi:hypothetical protein